MEKAGMTLARTYRMTPAQLLAADTFCPEGGELFDGDDVEYALDKAAWEQSERHNAKPAQVFGRRHRCGKLGA